MASLMLTREEKMVLYCCVCGNLCNDPVLLPCFCSCCIGCLKTIRSGENAECPLCKEKFETRILEKSTYVSSQITILRARNDLSNCNVCEDDGDAVAAQYRCHECEKFLCQKCFDVHRRHMPQHNLEDLSSYISGTNDVSSLPRAICKEHKQVLGIVCQQCKCLMCAMCVEVCLTAKHDLVGLKQHVKNVVREIQAETIALIESSLTVDRLEQVIRESDNNRKEHTAYMESNKITLLATLTSSFDASKIAAENFYGHIVQEAQKAIHIVSLLKHKIERFSTYCQSVAESGDVESLVNQHQRILARLKYLLNEKRNAPTSIAVNKIVIDDDHLESIGQIICKYVGIPKPAEVYEREQKELQDFRLKVNLEQEEQQNARLVLVQERESMMRTITETQRQLQDEQQKFQEMRQQRESELMQTQNFMQELSDLKQLHQETKQKVEDMQLQREKERQKTKEVVRDDNSSTNNVLFGFSFDMQSLPSLPDCTPTDQLITLESPHVIGAVQDVFFQDVAVASSGSVFVATSAGAREYDSVGSEVSRPLRKCDVYSIDVFGDGCVAAGISDGSVSILSCDETQSSREWNKTGTFKTEVLPRCLAVALGGSCISVANGRLGEGSLWCIYSCSGKLLLRKDLRYAIWSLASCAAAVVVSSADKRDPPLGGHSVEAYNYSGQLLWQRWSSNRAYDLCPDPDNRCVYTTVWGKKGLRVLRGEGHHGAEEDIVSGSEALQEPHRMSMDSKATCLAVISGYGIQPRTVTAFSVVRR